MDASDIIAMGTGKIDASWYDNNAKGKTRERISAGGVVVRLKDADIMLALARYRHESDYVLPKGGVDKAEGFLEAAEREIEEEAGFSQLRYLASLDTLQRFNYRKTRWSITHYFLFITEEVKVKPTEKKRHARPHWYSLEDFPNLFWPEQTKLIHDSKALIERHVANYRQHYL